MASGRGIGLIDDDAVSLQSLSCQRRLGNDLLCICLRAMRTGESCFDGAVATAKITKQAIAKRSSVEGGVVKTMRRKSNKVCVCGFMCKQLEKCLGTLFLEESF